MINLWNLIIYGCVHKWVTIKSYKEYGTVSAEVQSKYDCRCEKCGIIKSFGGCK